MSKILYVEDDQVLAESVKQWLEAESYTVELVTSAEDALQLVANFSYEIILLDWDLPGRSGVEFCSKYRSMGGSAWIVFITGRTEICSLETALQMGGDEFLSKPFSTRELSARLRALLRRVDRSYQSELKVGDVLLDSKTHTLHVGDQILHLMPKENALLEFLMRNLDTGYSTKELLASVWSSERDVTDGIVRTYIRQVRKKLQTVNREDLIETVAGIGYIVRSSKT